MPKVTAPVISDVQRLLDLLGDPQQMQAHLTQLAEAHAALDQALAIAATLEEADSLRAQADAARAEALAFRAEADEARHAAANEAHALRLRAEVEAATWRRDWEGRLEAGRAQLDAAMEAERAAHRVIAEAVAAKEAALAAQTEAQAARAAADAARQTFEDKLARFRALAGA
jgi:colicin import membrane protein